MECNPRAKEKQPFANESGSFPLRRNRVSQTISNLMDKNAPLHRNSVLCLAKTQRVRRINDLDAQLCGFFDVKIFG
jgi:hypothetical protein